MKSSFIKKLITMIIIFIICSTAYLNADTIGDINNDNTVDTTEAVYALQVSAGISTPITSNDNNNHTLDAADGSPKNALYVDNDGKVGIGTPFPSADLCVKANKKFNKELTGRATVGKNSSRVNGSGTIFMEELSIGDIVLLADQIVSITKIADDEQLILNEPHLTGALDEKMYISGDIVSIQDTIGQNKIVVDKKGNMGIGTRSPNEKLVVNGNIEATGQIFGQLYSHYDNIFVENESSIERTISLNRPGLLIISSDSSQKIIASRSSLYLNIYIDNLLCGKDASHYGNGNCTHFVSATCIMRLDKGEHQLKVDCGGSTLSDSLSMQYVIINDK